MGINEVLLQVAESLEAARFRFMLIGGMAVATWIEPRLTRDVDIVVPARRRDAPRLKQALIAGGARPTALEMRLLFEKTFTRLPTGGPILDVHIARSSHDYAAIENARPLLLHGRKIPVASPEDLVLYKLQAWRPHDQVDIQEMMKQVKNVNIAYIDSWLDRISEDTGAAIRERWAEAKKLAKAEEGKSRD